MQDDRRQPGHRHGARRGEQREHREYEIKNLFVAQDQYEYVATVIERASNSTRVVTFRRPDFNLSKLEPGTHYSIRLFAQNKIGELQSCSAFLTLFQSIEAVLCNKYNLCNIISLSYQDSRHNG